MGSTKWRRTNRPKLFDMFVSLLTSKEYVMGICLNEVGNLDDLLDEKKIAEFNILIEQGFESAGASQHGNPQIFWSGETVVAFRAEIGIRTLPPLTEMHQVHSWRVIERFEIVGASGLEQCKFLLYNTHQPASSKRPLKQKMRVDVCKAVILDAIQHHGDASDTIGFGFGGDGNCSFATWQLAFADLLEVSPGRSPFDDPHYMIGVNAKDGDVMIGCGVPGLRFEKTIAPFQTETNNTTV